MYLIKDSLNLICFFIGVLLPLMFFSLLTPTNQHRVIRIIQGDTIIVDCKGRFEKVSLLGVDTPDIVDIYKAENVTVGQAALDYTKTILEGKFVKLEFRGPSRSRDGLLLAYVFVKGKNFNLELVRKGLSPYHKRYGYSKKYHTEFQEAERHARANKLGIWAEPGPKAFTQKAFRKSF
jgi:micrococcal nuclease